MFSLLDNMHVYVGVDCRLSWTNSLYYACIYHVIVDVRFKVHIDLRNCYDAVYIVDSCCHNSHVQSNCGA